MCKEEKRMNNYGHCKYVAVNKIKKKKEYHVFFFKLLFVFTIDNIAMVNKLHADYKFAYNNYLLVLYFLENRFFSKCSQLKILLTNV